MKKKKTLPLQTILYIVSGTIIIGGVVLLFIPGDKSIRGSLQLPESITQITETPAALPEQPKVNAATEEIVEQKEHVTTKEVSYEEWLTKGTEFLQQQELTRAISAFQAASSKNPQEPYPKIMLGDTYTKTGKLEDAMEIFQGLLQSAPQSALYQRKVAEVRLHQVDSGDSNALKDAKSRLTLIPEKDGETLYLLCIIEAFENNTEMAQDICQEAYNALEQGSKKALTKDILDNYLAFSTFRDGSTAYVEALNAKAFTEAEFHGLAIAKLAKVLEYNRNYRDAWVLLGYNYLLQHKYELALVALDSAYALDSTKAHVQYLLGLTHDKLDNKEKAISFYTLAINNQYDKEYEMRQRLTELYVDLEKYDLALKEYLHLIEKVRIDDPNFYTKPMWIYIDVLKDPTSAVALGRKIKAEHPSSPIADNLIGWAYLANKNYESAKSHLERSIELDPSFAAPYLNLGKVFEQLGNIDGAKKLYYSAYEKSSESSIRSLAAKQYNALVQK